MRIVNLNFALAAVLFCAATGAALAQQPTPLVTQPPEKLIAVIKSDASLKDKMDACRQLAVIGTREAVPALAALLNDAQLNHMARYALETLPDPAADQALRDALASAQGRPLVGVIGSLGVRKDPQAVQPLTRLLQDGDADVAQAAARALGSIATPAAAEALRNALTKAPASHPLALVEGLLRCAESFHAKGERKLAISIYDQLRGLEAPQQVRVAAVRGSILARGDEGVSLLREQLGATDYLILAAAVRTAYEMPGPAVTRALAERLTQLADDDRKILVIQALAKRTDPAALPALAAAARSGPKPVRVAAIQALGETGNASVASMLAELTSSDREFAQAALDSFGGLEGSEVDGTIRSMLAGQDPARRLAAIELMGRRRMTASVPDLLKAATDANPQVRAAAVSRVGELGGPAEVNAILDLLPRLEEPGDLDAAEQALSTLCAKESPETCTDKIAARLGPAAPPQKGVLLRVLSSVGGPGALQAVKASIGDPDPLVHAAALRALGSWKTADAAPHLLDLARNASSPIDRTLALRSYLGLAANPDVPAQQRLQMSREVAGLAKTDDEKRLLLGTLGSIDSPNALTQIMPYLEEPATREEASAAIASVAERLLKNQKGAEVARSLIQPLEKVAKTTANEALAKRVNTLLAQARKRAES